MTYKWFYCHACLIFSSYHITIWHHSEISSASLYHLCKTLMLCRYWSTCLPTKTETDLVWLIVNIHDIYRFLHDCHDLSWLFSSVMCAPGHVWVKVGNPSNVAEQYPKSLWRDLIKSFYFNYIINVNYSTGPRHEFIWLTLVSETEKGIPDMLSTHLLMSYDAKNSGSHRKLLICSAFCHTFYKWCIVVIVWYLSVMY